MSLGSFLIKDPLEYNRDMVQLVLNPFIKGFHSRYTLILTSYILGGINPSISLYTI
jgi:hypothetical protein